MEPRTIALVLALAVGLGLAVHENFFAAGLAVLAFVAAHWTTQKAREYLRGFNSLRMGRVYNKLRSYAGRGERKVVINTEDK